MNRDCLQTMEHINVSTMSSRNENVVVVGRLLQSSLKIGQGVLLEVWILKSRVINQHLTSEHQSFKMSKCKINGCSSKYQKNSDFSIFKYVVFGFDHFELRNLRFDFGKFWKFQGTTSTAESGTMDTSNRKCSRVRLFGAKLLYLFKTLFAKWFVYYEK